MSGALTMQADTSGLSSGTHPDLSLSSLSSSLSIPTKSHRGTAPISTSSLEAPPEAPSLERKGTPSRRFATGADDTDGEDGALETPQKKRWTNAPNTPVASMPKRRPTEIGSKGTSLTLRDQEKHIDNLKKENFNVKLRVHFLEERLAQLAPDQIDAALKQNINLKIEVQQRGMELKKLKKLVLELERGLERQQHESARYKEREHERGLLEENMVEIEREAVEEDLNAVRDKLAAATIELQQKDDELEEKQQEIEELIAEHHRIVEVVEQEWRGEVEEARGQVEELRDVLAERDAESNKAIEKLSGQIYELEDENDKLKEENDRQREEEAAVIEKLSGQIYELEDENDKLKEENERQREEEAAANEEIDAHRSRQEELVRHIEDLVEEIQRGRHAHETLESQLVAARQTHELEQRQERSALEAKEVELRSVREDLSRTQSLLSRREMDLQAVQTALQTLEMESKKTGESHATAEMDLLTVRARVAELEQRLSEDQRSLLNAESQYRDQLTERNTLLLTIYQYTEKILGVDKTPKKGTQGETKPFTNFSVFRDNLIARFKALSQIQTDFEKRCKEIESRFAERTSELKKQLDKRWKQIDQLEANLKTNSEVNVAWRRKLSAKEGELEVIKSTNAELTNQLMNASKAAPVADTLGLRALSARAVNAERRLMTAQNQLAACEEKVLSMGQKTVSADLKWEARVKEYETRLKAAEERVKRERQGGKERVVELENTMKSLQRQLELAHRRNKQLNDVIEVHKGASSETS